MIRIMDFYIHFFILLFSYRFSPETASRRGLSTAEINAVEAIHRAVEFNPHVPKVRNFMMKILLLFKFIKVMKICRPKFGSP